MIKTDNQKHQHHHMREIISFVKLNTQLKWGTCRPNRCVYAYLLVVFR